MGDALARANSDDDYVQAMADAYLNADLNARLIQNKAATMLPLAPDGGIDGIFINDLLIVDRSYKPKPNAVIFAEVNGEFCLRRLRLSGRDWVLEDDKGFVVPRVMTNVDFYHGTVTHNIHPHY